jgi:hypothetical protein
VSERVASSEPRKGRMGKKRDVLGYGVLCEDGAMVNHAIGSMSPSLLKYVEAKLHKRTCDEIYFCGPHRVVALVEAPDAK